MSEKNDGVSKEKPVETETMPEISAIDLHLPGGVTKIYVPKNNEELFKRYGQQHALSIQLGEAIIAISNAKKEAESNANALLIQLLATSNKLSMMIGRDQERNDPKKTTVTEDSVKEVVKGSKKTEKNN